LYVAKSFPIKARLINIVVNEHVARVGGEERRGNLRERDHFGDPGIDGRIILRWIFRKWDVGVWTGSRWLRIGAGGGHLRMQ